MNAEEKKLWLELYDIAKEFQVLEPWKYLWDTDLSSFVSQEYGDRFYCCVMGKGGEHTALGIYNGRQMCKFFDVLKNDYPDFLFLNYQDCLKCVYLSRDETLVENRKLIKELGLKFRGTWISFECYEKGYEPRVLNIEEVKVMIYTLKKFYIMFKDFIDKKVSVDFEKGEMLEGQYDEKENKLITCAHPIMAPVLKFAQLQLDEEGANHLKNVPFSNMELEYEFMNYLPLRVNDMKTDDGKRCFPRVRMIADRKTGMILNNDIIDMNEYDNEEEYIYESVDVLLQFFERYGRPKKIYVRDKETEKLLSDIMDAGSIKVVRKAKLKILDGIYRAFMTGIF